MRSETIGETKWTECRYLKVQTKSNVAALQSNKAELGVERTCVESFARMCEVSAEKRTSPGIPAITCRGCGNNVEAVEVLLQTIVFI